MIDGVLQDTYNKVIQLWYTCIALRLCADLRLPYTQVTSNIFVIEKHLFVTKQSG